jgi:copper transport protein
MLKPVLRMLVGGAMLGAFAASAFAHAVLLEADPADGAVLAAAPQRVTLTFNEPVTPIVVRLLGADGKSVALPGEPTASDQTVSVGLPADLHDGGYILSYRVISLDSHPIAGSLAFAVGGGSVPAAPATDVDVAGWDVAYSALRWATMTGLFLLIGGALFRSFALPFDARSTARAAVRLGRIAGPAAGIAAILSVGVRGAQLAGSPLAELLTWTPWRIALGTSMSIGVAAILVGLAIASLWPNRKAPAGAAVVLAAIGLGITSHAALAEPIAVSYPAYLVHIVAAAFWFGSLPLLAAALAREPLAKAQAIVARFSTLAVWGVVALLIAGVVLTLAQTGPNLSVWAGPAWTYGGYGWLLAAKLALVAIVLALAIRNKRALTPLLMRRKAEAPMRLRLSIAWEAAVMAAVIALAAALGSSVPPRSIAALETIHDHHAGGAEGAVIEVIRNGTEILLEADPATPGPNELIVHFLDQAKGVHLAPMEVSIAATLPSSGIEPLRRAAVARGDGTYRVAAMPLTAGVWKIRIEALITDFDQLTATVDLPIGVPSP